MIHRWSSVSSAMDDDQGLRPWFVLPYRIASAKRAANRCGSVFGCNRRNLWHNLGMLIPQFSLRWLLAVMTAASVVFLVVSFAARGQFWAMGASIGVLSLVVALALYGVTFFLVWLFAMVTARRRLRKVEKLPLVLLVLASASELLASGAMHILPLNQKPTASGLLLTVDTTWAEGFGYRPVTFTANCTPPSNADRTLSFELRYHDWNPGSNLLTARCDLEIPAGAKSATITIAVPDFSYFQGYSLDVWEDGRHVPALSAKSLGGGAAITSVTNEAPAILFVANATPKVQTLTTLFPAPSYMSTTPAQPGVIPFPQQWCQRTPNALPDEWLCYQNLDLIFISSQDLEYLATNAPQRLAAIRDWLKSGGNLVVTDAAGESGSTRIDELLKLPAASLSPSETSPWQTPAPAGYRNSFADHALAGQDVQVAVEVDENGNVVTSAVALTPPAEAGFRWRTVQQGAIVAVAASDPFTSAFASNDWYWLFNTLGSQRWLSIRRNGVSFDSENTDFWMFLIPGVGGAPVDAYRILLTVFVVLIGPVNYLVLRKHGRLHLLLFTVPASALLVTLCLLSYALIADGLHTRVRSRSLTMLDQRTGDSVAWSRISYYAGLAPSEGLRFSDSIAAIPYEYQPEAAGGMRVSRSIEITPDQNQFKRGWLASRTPTQLLTVRPGKTDQKLIVSRKGDQIAIENRLGTNIRYLVLQDEPGVFGCSTDIYAGKQATLFPVQQNQPNALVSANPTIDAMRKAFAENAPSLPPGFSNEPRYGFFGFRNRRYYYGQGNSVNAAQSTNRLETGIEFAKAAVLQAGVSGDSNALTPHSYIAIVDRPEEIPLGLEGATETEGFHLIRGNW